MLKIKITLAVVYAVQSKWPTSAGPCPDKLFTNQKDLQQKHWIYITLDSL